MKLISYIFIPCLLFTLFSLSPSRVVNIVKKTEFVYIPSGTFSLDTQKISVQAFYMLDHEVTNLEYRIFIKEQFIDKGDLSGVKQALPDTNAWVNQGQKMSNDPMKNHYFSHPAFNNYPVLNISKENAVAYCFWLSQKLNLQYPDNKLNDCRLPTKLEWIYAAKGGHDNTLYPWVGQFTRNKKGCQLANFREVSDSQITTSDSGQLIILNTKNNIKSNSLVASSKSYFPNDYGLFNMSGNVSELVSNEDVAMGGNWYSAGHDIRVTSEIDYQQPNPFVGFRPIMTFISN